MNKNERIIKKIIKNNPAMDNEMDIKLLNEDIFAIHTILHRILSKTGNAEFLETDKMKDTPARILKAWYELAGGYEIDETSIIDSVFEAPNNNAITVSNIEYSSVCEHHLMPFFGEVSITYKPGVNMKMAGLSKFARIVDVVSKRYQTQETMTQEICDAIVEQLQPMAVTVEVTGEHTCMSCRGVRKAGSVTSTKAHYLSDNLHFN